MNIQKHIKYLEKLKDLSEKAGSVIMKFYHADNQVKAKSDGSPLTLADSASEKVILEGLEEIATGIPIVSEENLESHSIEPPERYFLVDPLDGTKEFIKMDGKGSFTVNIALIECGFPTLGVIYAPALNRMFYGSKLLGAFENQIQIFTRKVPATGSVAVASLSHRDEKTNYWLKENRIRETISIGSSLKFCLLACGQADIYPRFGPTMEWDTAAGQAILESAGGRVEKLDGTKLNYGKKGFLNDIFIARGK